MWRWYPGGQVDGPEGIGTEGVGVEPREELVVHQRGCGGGGLAALQGQRGGRREGRGRGCLGRGRGRRRPGRGGQQLPVEVEVGRVAVARPLGGEGRVAAVHAAAVHQLEVDVLVVGLDSEVVLEHFATGGAAPGVFAVQGYLLGADEAAVLVARVGDEATVRIRGRCGGRGAG